MTREEEIEIALLKYIEWRGDYGDYIAKVERDAAFKAGATWADSTYIKGDIEKESESYAQGVIGDISEAIRYLLATAYIAGAKRIER